MYQGDEQKCFEKQEETRKAKGEKGRRGGKLTIAFSISGENHVYMIDTKKDNLSEILCSNTKIS